MAALTCYDQFNLLPLSLLVLSVCGFVFAQQAPPAPAKPETPPSETEKKTDPNLLGRTNVSAGESRRNENIFITALDNNSQRESNTRLGTSATPITEFQSASRYFGAEFGVAPSSAPHLAARQGIASPHASLVWTHANSAFSARSFFQVGDVLPARENIVALRLSAPLGKNTYYSFDGDLQNRSGFVNGNILVPKANERSCLSPDSQICNIINRFFRAWPLAEPNRTDINERALNTNAPQSLRTQIAAQRLDKILGKQRLTARHSWTHQSLDSFQLVAGQNPDTTTVSHDARLTWAVNRNPNSLLELSATFQRNRSLLVPEPNAVGPQVQIGTVFEKLGPGSSIPIDRAQNRYSLSARLQQNIGSHTLSAGAEVARLHFNGREASSNRGNIYFRNDFGRDALENFRLGAVSRYSFGEGELARGFRRWDPAWFIQDTWRINARLQASFGLRYQPVLGMSEVNNLNRIPFRCDCNNFAPHLGLAWRPHPQLGILRLAYATQYGEVFPATLQQLRWNPPGFQKIENQAPPLLNLLQGVVFDPNGRAIVFNLPPDLRTPYSHQYSFSWQLPLPARWGRLDAAYVGSRTWKLLYMQYLNRALVVPGIPQNTATINLRRPDSRFFDFRLISNLSRAYFDAARLNYSFRTRSGLVWESSYWFSKAIDTGASYLNIAAGDDANQGHSQTADDVVGDLRGPSAFDQSHAFLQRTSWESPLRGSFLRGWRFSAVFLAKSGIPFTVISGADSPGIGNVDGVSGDRPSLVDPSVLGRTISHPDTSQQQLPRGAFRYIGLSEARGNLGQNVFRRAGFRNLNASIERRFASKQDRAFRVRAEALNALNTPQFADPVADLSNPAFGRISNTLNAGRAIRLSIGFEF